MKQKKICSTSLESRRQLLTYLSGAWPVASMNPTLSVYKRDAFTHKMLTFNSHRPLVAVGITQFSYTFQSLTNEVKNTAASYK